MLAALQCVDYVTIFPDATPIKLIEAIRPDVLVKGADYQKSRGRRRQNSSSATAAGSIWRRFAMVIPRRALIEQNEGSLKFSGKPQA